MERFVWTTMLFPGYRPAVFDDIPITAIITMESVGTGTRYVFTALHREGDLEGSQAFLALVFVSAAWAELMGNPEMVALFTAVGLGQWFRYVAGSSSSAVTVPASA